MILATILIFILTLKNCLLTFSHKNHIKIFRIYSKLKNFKIVFNRSCILYLLNLKMSLWPLKPSKKIKVARGQQTLGTTDIDVWKQTEVNAFL